MKSANIDILDEMTKAELISVIRSHWPLIRVRRSDVLFSRWSAQSQAVLEEGEAETERFKKIDFKQRDEYARQFNASTNMDEKQVLFDKVRSYDNAFKKHIDARAKIDKKQRAVDSLYEQIDIERKKESA